MGLPLNFHGFVKEFLNKQERSVKKFANSLPGNDWAFCFIERDKGNVSTIMSKNIKRARATVSVQSIKDHFDNLEQTFLVIQPCSIVY